MDIEPALIIFLVVTALLVVVNHIAKFPAPTPPAFNTQLWINVLGVLALVVVALLVSLRVTGHHLFA